MSDQPDDTWGQSLNEAVRAIARKTGRPSDFTPEIANLICERLAEGESLRAICKDEEMPSARTVHRWLESKEEWAEAFRQQYAHAREVQADTLADQVIEIADDTSGDPTRDRLRVDARKWAASKLAPKRYGDKLAVGGADDLPPVKSSLTVEFV